MSKKGFTLIELLAVITILSIIVLIASVSVSNVLKDSKEDLSNAQIQAIKAAAEAWGADNIDDLPTGNSCSYLTLKDLKEDGLLDSNITDPKNKQEISNDLKIKIESKMNGTGNSNLTYEVNPDSIQDCSYIGSDMYVDVP